MWRVFRRSSFERGMADEISFHIERRTEDLVNRGVERSEAERQARIEFGSLEGYKERCREAGGFRLFDELRCNILYALRSLCRRPSFTATAILSLAIGIGPTTAIFSLVDGLWFRPLAVPHSQDVIRIFALDRNGSEDIFSWPEYRELARQADTLRGVAACGRRGASMPLGDGSSEELTAQVVSTNFFSLLGVQPALGRVFMAVDDQNAGANPPVILGYSFWVRRFGADLSIIGKAVRFGRNRPVFLTVVGVLPKDFRDTDPSGDRDVWLPPESWAGLGGRGDFEDGSMRWFELFGRPAPGASVKAVHAQIAGIAARLAMTWPATNAGRSAVAVSDFRYRMKSAGSEALIALAVIFLLVILCSVNVANLLLARGASRMRELSIRLALGASRRRIVRQLMTENAIMGAGGLVAGILLGAAIVRAIPLLLIEPPGYRSFLDVRIDGRVFLFSIGIYFLTIFLFGLLPAVRGSRSDVASGMKPGASGLPLHSFGLRHRLVVVQVGLSLALVAVSGVLVRSFVNTQTRPLGLARREQLLLELSCPDRNGGLVREAAERLRALPGVVEVSWAKRAPLALWGGGMVQNVTFFGRSDLIGQPAAEILYDTVSSNFFEEMGIPILRGRTFADAEQTTGPTSAIINEQMAQRYWPAGDPLDRIIRVSDPAGADLRIIGIAKDAPVNAIGEEPRPYLYVPWWRDAGGDLTFIVRTSGPAALLARAAREALGRIDRRLEPGTIYTEADLIRYSVSHYQMAAELLGTFSLIGLVLTAVGLYGVVAHGVTERTREIGIRMALGASTGETIRLVLVQALRMGVIGLAAGLPLALMGTRLASAMLFGIGPWDPGTLVSTMLLLIAVLLGAAFIPARRAARIQPTSALRYE